MDTALVSMAQQFTGLPMQSLIGAPLNAAATANSQMALTQTKFLLDTCFNKKTDKDTESYEPILIKMELTRGVITPPTYDDKGAVKDPTGVTSVTTSFNLPLMTIIPINSLAVETADVSFEMEVQSSYSEEKDESSSNKVHTEMSYTEKMDFFFTSTEIKGSASYDHSDSTTHNTHYQKSNSAKYTVNVHAGQLPLPKGVNTIIEAFTKAIEPITMPTGPKKDPK